MPEESDPDSIPPKRSNFIRFLAYVAPYKWYVVGAVIGGIVKFGVPLLIPEVIRHLLDEVLLNEAMTEQQKLDELLLYIGGMMVIFVFFWSPLVFVRHWTAGKAGHNSVFDLRTELYYRILRMSAAFFDRNKSGSIVSRLISDIELAQNLVGSALTNIWMDMISIILILFFLVRIDLGITLVSLVTFPLYLWAFAHFRKEITSTSHQVQEGIATMSGNLQEKIAGSKVVHAFTQEQNEEKQFEYQSTNLLSKYMRRVYLQSLNMTVTGIIVQLAPLIVLFYGGYRAITGTLTVGELVAARLYLTPLYTPLQRFTELNVVFSNSMAALDRVFEIMDEQPEIRDRPNAISLGEIEGRVSFEHVNFTYHNEDAPGAVLRDIHFTVEPGQQVALVGPSGAGKSTLASLIPRFYDVDSETSAVRIDGHDVRNVKMKSLRRHIGVVLQHPVLFSGTILDNIRYGKPSASEQEIVAACKAANAYDFIMNQPNGFQTHVGEGGTGLSGGQKQRITIARAFLKDPKILILDEATSALDSQSEQLIQDALEKLMEGRTTFVIAHRLSTIVNADRIIVMDQGRMVESGTHKQLLNREGLYRRLYA